MNQIRLADSHYSPFPIMTVMFLKTSLVAQFSVEDLKTLFFKNALWEINVSKENEKVFF